MEAKNKSCFNKGKATQEEMENMIRQTRRTVKHAIQHELKKMCTKERSSTEVMARNKIKLRSFHCQIDRNTEKETEKNNKLTFQKRSNRD